ncbi:hypothetical protein HK099_006765 [Clydaea vesicula]|uniref:Uncharacterized protein n=1 Tax=Clydaea vesicula TaxID=447962 RepID=A0AAD5U245_9FUNG|nr:hypothetical protein HK099_006765 [Clydaea vesicula]
MESRSFILTSKLNVFNSKSSGGSQEGTFENNEFSETKILLNYVPKLVALLISIGVSYSSDVKGERALHISIPIFLSAVGFSMLSFVEDATSRFTFLFIIEPSFYLSYPLILSYALDNVHGETVRALVSAGLVCFLPFNSALIHLFFPDVETYTYPQFLEESAFGSNFFPIDFHLYILPAVFMLFSGIFVMIFYWMNRREEETLWSKTPGLRRLMTDNEETQAWDINDSEFDIYSSSKKSKKGKEKEVIETVKTSKIKGEEAFEMTSIYDEKEDEEDLSSSAGSTKKIFAYTGLNDKKKEKSKKDAFFVDDDDDRTLNNITINVSLLSQGSYQIESVVNKKKTVVTRTQHEVERLYNVLQLELKNHIIPSFPTCSMDLKFLLEKLTNFFNNLLNINDCLTNVNFLSFLESEFLFNPVVGNSINPGLEKSIGNNKSFFNFFGGGSNTQDNDVYFENALKLTNQIDIGIIEIGKLCEKLARSEKSYSIHCSDLVTKFGVLAEETSPVESYQMLSLLSEYEQQCKVTQKKIQNLEKLKSSSSIKTDKVDVASNELFEVKKTETEVKDTLTSTSETIKREYDDFKFLQDYELGAELDKFVGKQLQVNKNLLKVWDNILKDLESLY